MRLMKKSRNIMMYAKAQRRQMFDKCYKLPELSLLRIVKTIDLKFLMIIKDPELKIE